MRKLVSILLLVTASAGAFALGLGNIELSSGLNQQFDARVELLAPTSSELDSLNIRIADTEAFDRAGIEWTLLLTSLRFEVEVNDTGPDYIHITSREVIREPFLNFLLEASWSSGRLFREYTVLLDPPLYDPSARRLTTPGSSIAESVSRAPTRIPEPSITSPAPTITSPAPITSAAPVTTTPAPAITPSAPASPVISSYSGDEYGPAISTDTLWSLASRVRPDNSVSVQQMMLAILRANPEAFIENNINGLRLGAILRIPDRDEILNTSEAAAIVEARSQNAMWEEIRGAFAGNAAQRPIGASSQPTSVVSDPTDAGSSELRLVSAGSDASGSGQSAVSSDSTGSESADLSLANEQVENLSSENSELRSRLEESDVLIQDLTRLIELKDDELANLQQQTVAEEIQEEVEQLTDVQEVVEDEMIEAEPFEDAADIIDEGITSLDLEETSEEMVTPEAIDTSSEEVMPPPAVTTTQAETMPADTGMVDRILQFVFANISLVGGALGAVLLGVLGLVFVRKRKVASSEEDGAAALTEFPDFEESAKEIDLSATAEDLVVDEAEEEEADVIDDEVPFIGDLGTAEPAQDVVEPVTAAEPAAEEAEASVEAEEPEEDPLAEVNVFLAYEHFDQAEQFVRDAIVKDPDNLEFHSKLLEVFYSSGDKVKYEEEAKVLNELVGGEGPHWEMAEIMWQEISPNRVLFSEPVEGDTQASEMGDTTGGGIVDLTANNESADDDALDFDLGMDAGETAGEAGSDEDILDLTSAGMDDVLDLTASMATSVDDDVLDMTAADDDDLLDISSGGEAVDDDLLDVTSHTTLEVEDGEELHDISSPGLNVKNVESVDAEDSSAADDNSMDFDISGLDIENSSTSDVANIDEGSSSDENIIDFDTGALAGTEGAGGDFDISLDDGDIELDMGGDEGINAGADTGLDISLDDGANDGGIELDFASEDEKAGDDEISLDLDMDDDAGASSIPDLDMESTVKLPKDVTKELEGEPANFAASVKDVTLELEPAKPAAPSATEIEDTVNMAPGLSLQQEEKDDDDDENHTVFVPRTADTGGQSAEDEVATKLDLAKAYVELGDTDSAKKTLDEIIAEGNDAQRQQAEDLKGQID